MVLNIIRQTIKEYNLVNKGDKVLIGLSGGADSVCLTHALCMLKEELGIEIATAHLNHGIRGEEASRDEDFAKSFSESLSVECYVRHVDIPFLAKESGESEETAGRDARYDFFGELCAKYGFTKIATAHNKNDSAETILMNFMRGSSINGLCGIPLSRGNIIRPIINVCRNDIENYCKEYGLEYMTDSTNLTDEYTRNKVRNILIPLIEKEFNSNFVNTMTDNSRFIKEDSEYIEKLAHEVYKNIVKDSVVSISELMSIDIVLRRRIIRNMLKDVYGQVDGVSSVYITDILNLLKKQSGTFINLADNVIARIEYGNLIVEKRTGESEISFEYEITCNESFFIKEIGKFVSVLEVTSRISDNAVYLNACKTAKIVIRNRRSGDKFYPSGMHGSKKIKQYFIDKKIPKEKRNLIPIIEINGVIAAVGNRVDKRFLFENNGIRVDFIDC